MRWSWVLLITREGFIHAGALTSKFSQRVWDLREVAVIRFGPTAPALVMWHQPAATCKSPIFSPIWSSKLYSLLERRTRLNVILSAALTLPPALTIFLNFWAEPSSDSWGGHLLEVGRAARQKREGRNQEHDVRNGGKRREMEKQTCRDRERAPPEVPVLTVW